MSPSETSGIISFLRDCLAEDRSSGGIGSVFGSRIRSRRFLAGSDSALADSIGIIDLPPSQAEPLIRDAALYRRERELLHGSLFMTGLHQGRPMAAPVLLHPIDAGAISGASSAPPTIIAVLGHICSKALASISLDISTINRE